MNLKMKISPNQSGFKPGDSCTNQLLTITHEIYKSFDKGSEVFSRYIEGVWQSLAWASHFKIKTKWYIKQFTRSFMWLSEK